LFDTVLHRFDYLAGESSELVPGREFIFNGSIHHDFFEEDSDTLNRLIAKRTLSSGELECIADFVGKVPRLKGFASRLMHLIISGGPKTRFGQTNKFG